MSKADDDEVCVDDLARELREELRKRGLTEALKWLDKEAAYDNGDDICIILDSADYADIPIPEHFIKDFEYLDRVGDIYPEDVDYLNEILGYQRERGLISY